MVRPDPAPLRPPTEAQRAWSLLLTGNLRKRLDDVLRLAGDPPQPGDSGVIGGSMTAGGWKSLGRVIRPPDPVMARFWTNIAYTEQALAEAAGVLRDKPPGWKRALRKQAVAALRGVVHAETGLPQLFDGRLRPRVMQEARRGRRALETDRRKAVQDHSLRTARHEQLRAFARTYDRHLSPGHQRDAVEKLVAARTDTGGNRAVAG